MTLHSLIPTEAKLQAPFVQKVDSAIHRINHYRHQQNQLCYPLDSDLSGGQRYPSLNNWGQIYKLAVHPYSVVQFGTFAKPRTYQLERNRERAKICLLGCNYYYLIIIIIKFILLQVGTDQEIYNRIFLYILCPKWLYCYNKKNNNKYRGLNCQIVRVCTRKTDHS